MVLALDPFDAVIGLEVETLVCDALTAPGTVYAVNVSGDATPDAWANCVESVGLIAVPSVQFVVAIPVELVIELVGLTEPPPFSTVQLMVTPWTGLLRASITFTASGPATVWPTVSCRTLESAKTIWVAPPTCAVIEKVTVVSPDALAVVVCVPGSGPSVRVVLVLPSVPVTEDVGFTEPPPAAAAQVIVTLGTGLPLASVTRTTCGVESVVPTCPVRLSPENFARVVAAPTFAVSTNVTGLPVRPADVAVIVSGFAVLDSVQLPTVAIPLVFVVGLGPVSEPFEVPGTAKVTGAPVTTLPLTSRTITDGGVATAVPAVAVWLFPAFTAICVAAPADTTTVVDVTPVRPVAPKESVRLPTSPVILRFANAAAPVALVVAVRVPPSAGLPVARAAVTTTPLWLTGLPAASCSCTTGCCGKTTSFVTPAEGSVLSPSCTAAPADSVITFAVSGTSVPDVNASL